MDLPIGFYPFSFEFLETLDPSTRRKYLSGLEKLWLKFFDIHTQHLSDYEKENYNFKQALHLRFLTQLTEFYNKKLPSPVNKTELFPYEVNFPFKKKIFLCNFFVYLELMNENLIQILMKEILTLLLPLMLLFQQPQKMNLQ